MLRSLKHGLARSDRLGRHRHLLRWPTSRGRVLLDALLRLFRHRTLELVPESPAARTRALISPVSVQKGLTMDCHSTEFAARDDHPCAKEVPAAVVQHHQVGRPDGLS